MASESIFCCHGNGNNKLAMFPMDLQGQPLDLQRSRKGFACFAYQQPGRKFSQPRYKPFPVALYNVMIGK